MYMRKFDRAVLLLIGFIFGMMAGITLANAGDKQIIYDKNGNRVGTIEKEAPWSDKSVIYDQNGNRVGTIEPQAPWSDKSVVRDNNGVTQETIEPQSPSSDGEDNQVDPFAPQDDSNN